MNTITFAGIEGQIIESSPHSSFLVVKLSDRITICGVINGRNIWDWDISEDEDSGFESFITYVGVRSRSEAVSAALEEDRIKSFLQQNGGYFGKDGSEPRKSKRCRSEAGRKPSYPFELKVRGLKAEFVVNCLNERLINS